MKKLALFLFFPAWFLTASPAEPAETKGRAELWTDNCARCHNLRSPDSYSDDQWEVIMHHMRLKANLTEEECRLILEFLKEGN